MPGFEAIESNLGDWEFGSQLNNNANCVPQDDNFKCVDDLTILKVNNLKNIGNCFTPHETDMQFFTNFTWIKCHNIFLPKKRVNYDKLRVQTKQH